jgi:hypothetical protein
VSYYKRDLAYIHDRGYGLHGDRCAPGILDLLASVRRLPDLLAAHGVRASVGTSFGDAELPPGLRSVTGRKN